MNISDHGELDYLTPNPTEVDDAIAREIRRQIKPAATNESDSLCKQMQRNGLGGVSLDEWLQS